MKQDHFLIAFGVMLVLIFVKALITDLSVELVLFFLVTAILFSLVWYSYTYANAEKASAEAYANTEKARIQAAAIKADELDKIYIMLDHANQKAREIPNLILEISEVRKETEEFQKLAEEMKKLMSLNHLATGIRGPMPNSLMPKAPRQRV